MTTGSSPGTGDFRTTPADVAPGEAALGRPGPELGIALLRLVTVPCSSADGDAGLVICRERNGTVAFCFRALYSKQHGTVPF